MLSETVQNQPGTVTAQQLANVNNRFDGIATQLGNLVTSVQHLITARLGAIESQLLATDAFVQLHPVSYQIRYPANLNPQVPRPANRSELQEYTVVNCQAPIQGLRLPPLAPGSLAIAYLFVCSRFSQLAGL